MRTRLAIAGVLAAGLVALAAPNAGAAGVEVCLGQVHLSVLGTTVVDQEPGCQGTELPDLPEQP